MSVIHSYHIIFTSFKSEIQETQLSDVDKNVVEIFFKNIELNLDYHSENKPFITAQKMKFSIKDFFNKCDQIRRKLRIWSPLLKKSLMKNLIFRAVYDSCFRWIQYKTKHCVKSVTYSVIIYSVISVFSLNARKYWPESFHIQTRSIYIQIPVLIFWSCKKTASQES